MSEERRRISHQEWTDEGKRRFGDDFRKWRFKCAQCGGVQTIDDFIEAKVANPGDYVYFSCIGRWVDDRGCDWTLGGLLHIHTLEVETTDGKIIMCFEFADKVSDVQALKDGATDWASSGKGELGTEQQ